VDSPHNDVGITRELAPPTVVRELASSARCVVASDLPRARESASWLVTSEGVRVDPELREAALPESLGISIRLPPEAWVVLARVGLTRNWSRLAADVMREFSNEPPRLNCER
jgi:hypothetical protein